MVNPFKHNTPLLKRSIRGKDNNVTEVCMGDIDLIVPNHPFWQKFAQGWEPETDRVFQSFVQSDGIVLDIGAWIGPTILFSLAYGAEKIVAVEPNPESFSVLQQMLALNPHIEDKVILVNRAVNTNTGTLTMGLDDDESDTSMFGINPNGIEINTTTVVDLIKDYQLEHVNLIKIDIEGAETLIHDDLNRLSKKSDQRIHLSIHVPFFPPSADVDAFVKCFEHFDVYDDRGEQLNHETLRHRLISKQIYPQWGTQHGNFFELLLITN